MERTNIKWENQLTEPEFEKQNMVGSLMAHMNGKLDCNLHLELKKE